MPAKPSTNKCDKHNSMVNRHIGTAYDTVKIVADNIEVIEEIGDNLPYLLKYLGAYSTPPTERPDGTPLQDGDYYFDSTSEFLVYYKLNTATWFIVDPQEILNARDEAVAARNAAQLAQANAESAETNASQAASTSTQQADRSEAEADRSEQAALASANSIVARGVWDASSGDFPTPTLTPLEKADWYRISVAGVMSDSNPLQPDVSVEAQDNLYWDPVKDIWYAIRNLDLVRSVDGQQGDVVIDKYTQTEVDDLLDEFKDLGAVSSGNFTEVKHRRGTNTEILAGTPAIAELWFNTTDNTIHMGDGVTQGGVKQKDFLSVKQFGAKGDGVTDDTQSLKSAIAFAEQTGKTVVFPEGTYRTGTIFLQGGSDLISFGAKMLHVYDQSQPNPNETLAAPVFFCSKFAESIHISGFHFEQDATTFPSVPYNWLSYFSPIIGYRANKITVSNCSFGSSIIASRGVFFRGGNYCTTRDNFFQGCGVSYQLGEESNFYFHDPVSDASKAYSPIGAVVDNNTVVDYSKTSHAYFFSGANQFTMTNNKCLRMNNTLSVGFFLRVGDLGATDINGDTQPDVYGTCSGNHVSGTCLNAYAVTGYTDFGIGLNNYNMRVVVSNNTCDVVGRAVNFSHAKYTTGSANNFKSTQAVIRMERDNEGLYFSDNNLECVEGTDESGSNNTAILITGNTTGVIDLSDNHLITGATTLHAVKNISTVSCNIFLRGLRLNFNATSGSPTPVFLRTSGDVNLYEFRFLNAGSAMSDRIMIDIQTTGDVNLDSASFFESASNARGLEISCSSFRACNTSAPALNLTFSNNSYVVGSEFRKASSIATPVVSVTGSVSSARLILGNTFIENTEPGARALEIRNCAISKVNNVYATASFTSSIVLVAVAGTMKYWALEIDNQGTGGNSIQENDTATAVKES